MTAQTLTVNDEEYDYDNSKIKITVVGDEEIGKTCLLMGYRPNNSSLVPSIFNSIIINKTVMINSKTNESRSLNLELCDTGPDEQYKQLRVMKSYKNVDIILVCFDINNINSLQNIQSIWLPEIQQFAPKNIIKLLIGLKSDLRTNQSIIDQNTLISMDEITQFHESHSDQFMDFIEVSALKKLHIEEAFEIGIQHFFTLEHKHRKSTVMNDDNDDYDENDIGSVVGTHQKQWNDYLRDQGGSVFSQYSNVSHNTSVATAAAAPMSMSYQSAQYNMGNHHMSMGMNSMGGMSYTQQPQMQSYAVGGGGGGGGNTLLGDVNEDQEIDVPPPPSATSPAVVPINQDITQEQHVGLKNNDGITNHKLSISAERTQSIDYGYDGKQKSGGCCVIL